MATPTGGRRPNMFQDPNHPLAGRIHAGIKTTQQPERRPRVSMMLPEMYIPTMEDYARQMFSEQDPIGTRVYYCESGTFNTADEQGRPIQFVGGLFKTTDREVKRFLQYFVDMGNIKYLQLGESNAQAPESLLRGEEHSNIQGSSSSPEQPNEQHDPQPEQREEFIADTIRSGTGGEDTGDTEQPIDRPAFSSEPGDGDDSESPNIDPVPEPELSALDKLRLKATG